MGSWEIVLLAAALSIDAFGIGVSCGFGEIRISKLSRTIIFLVSVFVTGAAVLCGELFREVMSEYIGKAVGSGLLIMLGIYMMIGAVKKKKPERKKASGGILVRSARILESPEECDIDESRTIDIKEALVLGLALSADSFAAGLGAGINGGMAVLIPLMCAFFQLILFYAGEKLAGFISGAAAKDKRIFGVIAGAVLVLTGLYRIIL